MVGMAHGRTHPPAGPVREPGTRRPPHLPRRHQRWRGSPRTRGCSTCGRPRWAPTAWTGPRPRVVTDDTDRGIRMFDWAHDGRHLLYLQDTGGDENWRLHDVDLATMQRRDLTPFEGVQAEIIATEKKFPTEILVGLNRDNPQLHDVYRLDLVTGELVKEVENPGFIGWVADAELVVRCGVARSPTAAWWSWSATARGEDWRPLLTIAAEDALTSRPMAFSADGASLLAMSSVGADTGRLVRIDLASGATRGAGRGPGGGRDRGPAAPGHPGAADRHLRQGADRSTWCWTPRASADLAAIRALHPGDPAIGGAGRRGPGVAGRRSPTTPARCRTTPTTGRRRRGAASCSSTSPSCRRYELAPMEPFTFTARDGLTVHGYATFPPGARAHRAADGAQRARRPVGAGLLGLRPGGAVARQPRLPVPAGQLPRLDRLRQGVRQRRRPGVGRARCRTT